MVITNWNN